MSTLTFGQKHSNTVLFQFRKTLYFCSFEQTLSSPYSSLVPPAERCVCLFMSQLTSQGTEKKICRFHRKKICYINFGNWGGYSCQNLCTFVHKPREKSCDYVTYYIYLCFREAPIIDDNESLVVRYSTYVRTYLNILRDFVTGTVLYFILHDMF